MQRTEKLAELICRKRQVLVQLRDIGRRQLATVAEGDTAALLGLLAAKQQLILALQEVEGELVPHYGEDPEQRMWRSASERARCADQAAQCNELLTEIVELERKSMDRMTVRRNEAASHLRQVYAASEARNAYDAQRRHDSAGRTDDARRDACSAMVPGPPFHDQTP